MHHTVLDSLKLFKDDDCVIEIRALNCWDSNPEYPCTRTGFFDNLDAAEKAVSELEAKWHPDGIYITLNPVKPDLLARSANRLRKGKKDEATANGDIIRRRWLLIDFDPVRPAGISASEDEVSLARASAMACWSWLTENGFPLPVVAMSGNGWHLLYRIELDADDSGLIKSCLAAIGAKWTSAEVSVDQKVFNAARITKLYGTLARKGDATKDRPHRRSELVEVPGDLIVVPADRLEWLAGLAAPRAAVQPSHNGHSSEMLRVDSWLSRHGVQPIKSDQTSDGSDRWFIRCPAIDFHKSKNQEADCCITRSPSGQLGGHCFHDSCGMQDWQSIKSAIGPLGYDDYHESEDVSGVNLDGLMLGRVNPVADEGEEESSAEPVDPGEVNPALFETPGLIRGMIRHNANHSKRPQPSLAMLGALTVLGAIAGRKVCSFSGIRTNLYGIGLADASSGKDDPRKANASLLRQAGGGNLLGFENPSSDQALLKELEVNPSCLIQIDEINRYFESAKGKGSMVSGVMTKLMEAFTNSDNPEWKPKGHGDRTKSVTVSYPNICLFGTCPAPLWWNTFDKTANESGFLPRMLVIETSDQVTHPRLNYDSRPAPFSQDLVEIVRDWILFRTEPGGLLSSLNPAAYEIPFDSQAMDRLREHSGRIEDRLPDESRDRRPIWCRVSAMAQKLAMLAALSRGPYAMQVNLDDANFGVMLANNSARLILRRLFTHVADDSDEAMQKRLLERLRQSGGSMKERDFKRLIRGVRGDKAKDDFIKSLLAEEWIRKETEKLPGRRNATANIYLR